MNDILKQRLVGAIIIILLAAFFWPVIFVGPEWGPMDRSSQVPKIPSLRQVELAAPTPLEGIAPAELVVVTAEEPVVVDVVEPSLAPAEKTGAATSEDRATEQPERLDKDGIPIAWTLQVVSVSKQEKAEELMGQLMAMGYKAYFKAVVHGNETLYRVYVGPKFERDKMQAAKRTIDKKYRVNSIVTRYLP